LPLVPHAGQAPEENKKETARDELAASFKQHIMWGNMLLC
jgi:hypothetical protein